MTLEQLKLSVTQLSEADALGVILMSRHRRMNPTITHRKKEPKIVELIDISLKETKAKRKPAAAKKDPRADFKAMLLAMSPEERKVFLASL